MSSHEFERGEPRGWSPLAVFLIVALVLLLGLGGALFGISVANKNKRIASDVVQQGFAPTAGATPAGSGPATITPAPPSTPAATPSATPGPTPSVPPSADPFPLLDLVDLDFSVARTKVRELGLGWRLVFEGADANAEVGTTVRATEPAASSTVRRGDTIKIFVGGTAPPASVPAVTGLLCDQAAATIVERGLYPVYLTGHDGLVVGQDPAAASPDVYWNDEVEISCGPPR